MKTSKSSRFSNSISLLDNWFRKRKTELNKKQDFFHDILFSFLRNVVGKKNIKQMKIFLWILEAEREFFFTCKKIS